MFASVDIGPSLDRALTFLNSPRLLATIESRSKKDKSVETSSASVQRMADGSSMVRLQAPPTPTLDRVDVIYRVQPDRVDGWNRLWNERLSVPVPKDKQGGTVFARLSLATSPTIEAELLTSPVAISGTFAGLRKVKSWQRTGNVWRAKSSTGQLEVRFDDSGRWVGYQSRAEGTEVSFRISYAGAMPAYAPSNSAVVVKAFGPGPRMPKGLDESYARSILAAHKHFRGQVVSPQVSSTIGSHRLSERRAGRTWQWKDDILTITYGGKTRSYKAKISDIIEKLGTVTGDGPDTYVRELILGRIPFANFLRPTAKVKKIGEASAAGQACDILEIESPLQRFTLFVRKKDRLIASVTVEGLGSRGQTMTRDLRTYEYRRA